jgi:SsrA-binding protein
MKIIHKNKKAVFDYELIEQFKAGMILLGSEIKSIRLGQINLRGSYVSFQGGKAYLKGANISRYKFDSSDNYDPFRDRELLLKKSELHKITNHLNTQGVTVVPIAVGIEGKYAKLEIAVARGKKKHDKREAVKERDSKRRLQRLTRNW